MAPIVLIYGFISGAIAALMMLLTMPFMDRIGFDYGMLVGYTAIIAAFLLVFFGIRAYRERHGGVVSFGRAFTVGILITLISTLCYVATWEVIQAKYAPDFVEKYTARTEQKMVARGASEQELAQARQQMRDFAEMYKKPHIRAAYTFLEPFPVGLLMTLISAGILRRRPRQSA